ncbi:hypothetical protein GCM10007301_55170 [Azorhizobium oxalatiphilum]|uniref:Uncharacterized protein n=1 Tax=Azorhizobium oxalatiphilum TaxID=980631 RepID=A0A917CGS1_9HYPH|nr:hypothetical protein [Azorhizobium oxalatiphilum]GGF88256.1 hypothetical protein GCM10007301_55170 [Azorhizobium oxalatiphilum]
MKRIALALCTLSFVAAAAPAFADCSAGHASNQTTTTSTSKGG